MKKFIFALMVSLITFTYAQNLPENRFRHEEQSQEYSDKNKRDVESESSLHRGPGSPGLPAPIDDYLPLLVIAAIGIIIYHTHLRKRNAC